jgi:hypothetical protein
MVYDLVKEFDRFFRRHLGQGHILDPLRELVDHHEHAFEIYRGRLKGPDHIQSPARKGLGGWYSLDLMCWYMYALHKKLTPVAMEYQLLYVGHGRRPVETYSESFADQCSRGGVIPAATTMNFFEQFNACLLSDTVHQDFFLCILAHEDAVDQYILFATAYKALILYSVSIIGSIL